MVGPFRNAIALAAAVQSFPLTMFGFLLRHTFFVPASFLDIISEQFRTRIKLWKGRCELAPRAYIPMTNK
jgi:hypothetical protein